MATKKASKAKAAAAKATGKSADVEAPEGIWTRAMVEQAIAAFNDLEAVPAYDDDAVAGLVDGFYAFVDVVARGDVELEALALASEMIRLGHAWLEKNPRHIRVNSEVWGKELVENTVQWFGAASKDLKTVKDTVARFAAFESVWRSGWVEAGEARAIAQAFVEHGKDWLAKTPEAKKAYEAL
ncbi:MAG: hypothetical protein Q8O67_33610 [Deltaproteobacteria bacterium]|nr:hypothetical protein [Deltaproteobacteria bacterium]